MFGLFISGCDEPQEAPGKYTQEDNDKGGGTIADVCGNGIIDSGELCDDDNFGGFECINFNGFTGGNLSCTDNCTLDFSDCIEPSYPYCGNGVREPGEVCDCGTPWDCYDSLGFDLGDLNCNSFYGYDGGNLSCYSPGSTSECLFDFSDCNFNNETSYCGDGNINPGEQCDGTNWGPIEDCTNFGFDGGTLVCTDGCYFDTSNCY